MGLLCTWATWVVLTPGGSGTDPDGDIVVGTVKAVLGVCQIASKALFTSVSRGQSPGGRPGERDQCKAAVG